uniref:Uncharacterized protein n=1 Tax=Corethron hystrix TaxID=216773 RepID=A0A7S1BQ04_9STRA
MSVKSSKSHSSGQRKSSLKNTSKLGNPLSPGNAVSKERVINDFSETFSEKKIKEKSFTVMNPSMDDTKLQTRLNGDISVKSSKTYTSGRGISSMKDASRVGKLRSPGNAIPFDNKFSERCKSPRPRGKPTSHEQCTRTRNLGYNISTKTESRFPGRTKVHAKTIDPMLGKFEQIKCENMKFDDMKSYRSTMGEAEPHSLENFYDVGYCGTEDRHDIEKIEYMKTNGSKMKRALVQFKTRRF